MASEKSETKVKEITRPFDITKHYDMNSFTGRFAYHLARVNPFLSFTSTKRIVQAQEELHEYKSDLENRQLFHVKPPSMTKKEINRMIKNSEIVDSSVDPNTLQIISSFWRISSFVPFSLAHAGLVQFLLTSSPIQHVLT